MSAWLEDLSTLQVLLLVLALLVGGSVAAAVAGGVLVRLGMRRPWVIRRASRLSYRLAELVKRPLTVVVLDEVVAYMNQAPHLILELSSHTDSRSSDAFNLELSQRRAQTCVDYIVAQGVESSRILAKGFGETRPLNHCIDGVPCTEAEHQQNRRTEFKVICPD